MGKKAGVRVDVLVVEDDPELRATMTELLDDVGYAVAWAENGAEALHLLDARVLPAVILLDLEMPVMSGWEFLKAQRRRSQCARIPVVVVTAQGVEPIVGAQVAGKLDKPTLMKDLLQTVERFASAAGGERKAVTADGTHRSRRDDGRSGAVR